MKARKKKREQNIGKENRNNYASLSGKVEFGDAIFGFFINEVKSNDKIRNNQILVMNIH